MQVTLYIGTLWREGGFFLVLFFCPYTTESILGSPEARTRVGECLPYVVCTSKLWYGMVWYGIHQPQPYLPYNLRTS